MLKSGMPPLYVEALLDLFAFMKAGKADLVVDTVEKVTGRKAGTFEAWARRNIQAFQSPAPAGAMADDPTLQATRKRPDPPAAFQ